MPRDNFPRPAARDRMRNRDGPRTPPPSRDRSRSPVRSPPVRPQVEGQQAGDVEINVLENSNNVAGNMDYEDIEVDVMGDNDQQGQPVATTSAGASTTTADQARQLGAAANGQQGRRESDVDVTESENEGNGGIVAMVPADNRIIEVGDVDDENPGVVAIIPGSVGSPRAGFRNDNREMVPIPEPERMQVIVRPPPRPKPKSGPEDRGERVSILSNFIKLKPVDNTHMHNYHVTFEPNIESASMRRKLFHMAFRSEFDEHHFTYDGMFDARSTYMTPDEVTSKPVKFREETVEGALDPTKANPHNITYEDTDDPEQRGWMVSIRRTGIMHWGNSEMLRIYNLNFKSFLRHCGLFPVTSTGAYVHPDWCRTVGRELASLQGFKTSTGVHEDEAVLVQLEFISKLLQSKNVLQNMNDLRQMGPNPRETINSQLIGRMIVTNYNKVVYKILEFNYDLSPKSTFFHKKLNREMTYIEYYQHKYNVPIQCANQPLILVEPQKKNRKLVKHSDKLQPTESSDIYVIPELSNLAGLTEAQRADTRLKTDLIRASQTAPNDRVRQMREFLNILFAQEKVKQILHKMKYDIEKRPVHITSRVIEQERIGIGKASAENSSNWPRADFMTASFEQLIVREKLVKAPPFKKLTILVTRPDKDNATIILPRLKEGFLKIGFGPQEVDVLKMGEGDQGHHFTARLRALEKNENESVLIILPRQNKDKYDTIKKIASIECAHVTQVVTSKLMLDDRKAAGAAIKIAIQVAAKMGAEPWFINLPLKNAMVCGYDTYNDTTNKSKTYGAFVASMNARYSSWWSRANEHLTDEQMSENLGLNLRNAILRWMELHGSKPQKIFIYRDGVSDGQLNHVKNVELKQVQETCSAIDAEIKIAFIVVNKKVGARFYLKRGDIYVNPIPGTCIDSVVTKADRFDFYLISQSTRQGTIAPTYYNVIYDDTKLSPGNHQAMAFKLCFAYYNWAGTVRVPAPCQYAHKLGQLCGETLHQAPSDKLDDFLHYL